MIVHIICMCIRIIAANPLTCGKVLRVVFIGISWLKHVCGGISKVVGFCGTELSNLQLTMLANIITILTDSCSVYIIITDDFIPLYMELDMLLLLEIIIIKFL